MSYRFLSFLSGGGALPRVCRFVTPSCLQAMKGIHLEKHELFQQHALIKLKHFSIRNNKTLSGIQTWTVPKASLGAAINYDRKPAAATNVRRSAGTAHLSSLCHHGRLKIHSDDKPPLAVAWLTPHNQLVSIPSCWADWLTTTKRQADTTHHTNKQKHR